MRMKLFLGVIFLATITIALVGCNQNTVVDNKPIVTQPTVNIKRTELTENAQYVAEMKVESGTVNAGQEAVLTFTVKNRQGEVVKNLQIVHEKPMHLLIVSEDLAEFAHVHPEQQPDGSFRIVHKFPNGGTYKLYVDFTPQNSSQIVNVFDLDVAGTKREKASLVADKEFVKTVDGLTFTMRPSEPLKANKSAMLNFYVTDAATGKPVTDLEPYLGELAHFVVISEDTKKFLHVHPMQGGEKKEMSGHEGHAHQHGKSEQAKEETQVKSDKSDDAKPTVVAHIEKFPVGGLYKLWAEFKRGGKIFTVPFVLNVASSDAETVGTAEIPSNATKITVSSAGFEPSEIKVKKGEPISLAFYRKDSNNCGDEVVFPKLNIKKQLPVGQTVLVEITPQESGELAFTCGMNMMKGKILVQ